MRRVIASFAMSAASVLWIAVPCQATVRHVRADAAGANNEGPSAAQSLEAGGDTVPDTVVADEQRALVREVIDEMPAHLREILLLGYYQQLPYAEIADVLEIPVGTVKSRLHAAVTHFAKLWHGRVKASADV